MQKVIRISLFLILGLVSFLGCSKKQTEKQQELILENETKPENSVFKKKKYPKKKKSRFKIETFIGEVPETDFVDFHTIQFKKKSGETITFDYGMWI